MLWLICRPEEETGYDEARGFVVCAHTEAGARGYIAQAAAPPREEGPGDEGPGPWTDPRRSPARLIGEAMLDIPAGIVLRDFKAG